MSDQIHPAAVRLQSSAMVAAAIITTLGAVMAACIQTGWMSKAPAINVGGSSPSASQVIAEPFSFVEKQRYNSVPPVDHISRPSPPIAGASFIGTIEPCNQPYQEPPSEPVQPLVPGEGYKSIAPQRLAPIDATQTNAVPATAASAAANTAAVLPSAPSGETLLTAGYAPALLAEAAPVKILPSPWSFITKTTVGNKPVAGDVPVVGDKPAGSSKTAKKPLDWGAVARFFPWHS
jgi:hypothetical protein